MIELVKQKKFKKNRLTILHKHGKLCNMGKKIIEEREAKQREASEKFAKRAAKHRHHWPFMLTTTDSPGVGHSTDISYGRCECGEPYREGKR